MLEPYAKSPSYRTTMSGLLRMHQLSLEGLEESETADLLREAMCEHWEGLTKVEKERFTGLSKDLYTISDGPVEAVGQVNPQIQAKLVEVSETRERGEWDRALELLRSWENHLPPALLSYLRGTIWQSADEPVTAALFFENASQLEPGNENYQAAFLETLKHAEASQPPTIGRNE